MPPYAFIFCDVFTDRPLAGNQLAVFPRGADVPESVRHVYVGLESAAGVGALAPDLKALEEVAPGTGVNCFSQLDPPGQPGPPGTARWKTRMFGPGLGVAEDPGTGSAAGPLALHLCRHGLAEVGIRIELSQGDELGRPSRLWARVTGSAEAPETIEVGGTVVSIARGEVEL